MKKPQIIFWIPFIILVAHTLDEIAFGFPDWATEHFGTTTLPFFVYHHIPLLILVGLSSYLAATRKEANFWKVLATVSQVQFAVNGLFHILTSIIFREPTPGIITATLLSLPLTYIYFKKLLELKLLTGQQIMLSLTLGLAIALLVIASLWLNGNIGWGHW
jgi:hypothetical protein